MSHQQLPSALPQPSTRTETAVVLAVLLLTFLALLAAAVIGQNRRCDWLRDHHDPRTSTYCSEGAPE